MEIVVCQENVRNSVNVSVGGDRIFMENHRMGHAKVYFSLFAVEAFSVLRLILVVSPLIMLHLHGGCAKSATHPAYTNHKRSMKSFMFEIYFLSLLILCKPIYSMSY